MLILESEYESNYRFCKRKEISNADGNDIRPTTDRVKEGIFSSIQFDLEGASVLDLFAGSGQLGIEALSRGADKAYFVDNSKKSLETVKKNLAITGLENKSKLFNMNGHDFLKITDQKFDFIFLDPPYDMGILTEILPDLCDKLKSAEKYFVSMKKILFFLTKLII